MAGVYTSAVDLIWCLIGFAIGIYLLVKGKKKLGLIKQK
jgi:Na+/H+ antiporter NhaD/arsenite permease-like protein